MRQILNIHLSLRNIPNGIATTSNTLMCLFYKSEGGRNGPWKLISGTDMFEFCSGIDIPDVFSIEYMFERPQPIRVELCAWSESEVTPLGCAYLLISDIVLLGVVVKNLNNEGTGASVGQMTLASTVKPKSTPLLIQFEGKNFSRKTLPESAALLFELSRCESNGNKTLLYKSEPLKKGARTVWKPFTVSGQENVEGRLRLLEVVCYFKDDKCRNVVVGNFSTTYEEMREPKEGFMLTNPAYKGGQKTCGQFDLVKCTKLKTFSFLDYLTFGTVLNFAFAIDFSDADVTKDRQAQIDFANNVEFAIRSIGETLVDCTRTDNFLAYGFGARIPPLYRESHEFCLKLETDPICVGVEGVVAAFRSTYMKAKPCTSAHFAHIIYHLAKSAQNATTRSDHNRPQYYILNIITRGAIDDVKETVQAAIFASKSPISIIFTGIGDRNLDEIERLGNGGSRLAFRGRKSDRDNLQFVNMTRVLLECDGFVEDSSFTLSEKSLYQIPRQITSYFIKNGVLPMEKQENFKIENLPSSPNPSKCISDTNELQSYPDGYMDEAEEFL